MGDTGSLFLGYMISVLSLLGLYKSVTLFSVVVPVIILGVPIFDTTFAIIRRILNKQPISSPDKSHIHHRLMAFGLSHRMAVIVIYMIGLVFSLSAILLTSATIWLSLIIIFLLVMFMQVIAEVTGLVNEEFKPFTKFYKRMVKDNKNSPLPRNGLFSYYCPDVLVEGACVSADPVVPEDESVCVFVSVEDDDSAGSFKCVLNSFCTSAKLV